MSDPRPSPPAQDSLLTALGQDDRVTRIARRLPVTKAPSTQELDDFRLKARALLKARHLSIAEVARQTDQAASVVSQFLKGTYTGDNERVARRLENWLIEKTSGEAGARATKHVSTTITEKSLAVIRQTKRDQTVGIIHGPAGVGKSLIAHAAVSLLPGTRYMQCTVGMRTPSAFARRLAASMGVQPARTLADTEQRLIEHLAGREALLIVDEAHFLSRDGVMVVRDIHKGCGCGVVLIGTQLVDERVDDAYGFSGQMSRLISYRYDITDEHARSGTPLFTTDEVERFVASMELRLTGDGVALAQGLACVHGWGGLGALEALLRSAELVRVKALKGKAPAITADHIRLAYRTTRGAGPLERVESLAGAGDHIKRTA